MAHAMANGTKLYSCVSFGQQKSNYKFGLKEKLDLFGEIDLLISRAADQKTVPDN